MKARKKWYHHNIDKLLDQKQTQTLTPSPSNQSAALAASGVMTEPKILPWLDPSLTRDQAQAVWEEYHLDNF